MEILSRILYATSDIFLEAAPYILFGIVISSLLKQLLPPGFIARHLGSGRALPVFKAAFLGIPLPLCSCGVLPAAVVLKKEGANRGAITSFVIATPESSVDSISVTWALLDPIMTVIRPLCAFLMAVVAGLGVNLSEGKETGEGQGAKVCGCGCSNPSSTGSPRGSCCSTDSSEGDGSTITDGAKSGSRLQGFWQTILSVWGDIVSWFFMGVVAAGIITALVPEELFQRHLGGGLSSMLLMLLVGIPVYICATASTPLAAAMILKGASPGAALVLMLTGPATNVTAISSLFPIIGRRAVVIYLSVIAGFAVVFGLATDALYRYLQLDVREVAMTAGAHLPMILKYSAAAVLIVLSLLVYVRRGRSGGGGPAAGDAEVEKKGQAMSCCLPDKDGPRRPDPKACDKW